MTPFPLSLTEIFGHWGAYVVYLIVGIAFGAVLEIAGFANSTKLAGQFYFKDQTVFKVMFTAIIVAMILIFAAVAVGLLDYNLIWVNPTYMLPGILGGLIMGFGFIIGGFCPGTSLVAAATLKLDGIMFALGAFFGIFLFGETVGSYESFWHSTYLGRFTIQDWLGADAGVVVLGILLAALLAFWGAEKLEQIFGGKKAGSEPRWRYGAAGIAVLFAVGLVVVGQPTLQDKWKRLETSEKGAQLANYEVQIHPGELLDLLHDRKISVIMLDVRGDLDYNRFHIQDARHVSLDELPDLVSTLHEEPPGTIVVTMSNDEAAATQAWKILVAESVPNAYILGGGINNWLNTFGDDALKASAHATTTPDDTLRYTFPAALGSRYPAADPNPDVFDLEYEAKVKLETKRGATSGGCG